MPGPWIVGVGSYAGGVTTPAAPTLETASWGRRIGALFVDWLTCLAIAQGLVATGVITSNPNGLVTLGLFVVESAVFTALVGGSFGKLATRLRVVRQDGAPQPIGLLASTAAIGAAWPCSCRRC